MLKWLRANKKARFWAVDLAKEMKTKTYDGIHKRGMNLRYYEKKTIKLTPVQKKIKKIL